MLNLAAPQNWRPYAAHILHKAGSALVFLYAPIASYSLPCGSTVAHAQFLSTLSIIFIETATIEIECNQ